MKFLSLHDRIVSYENSDGERVGGGRGELQRSDSRASQLRVLESNSQVLLNPMNYRRCPTICCINANAGCYRIVQQAQIEQRGPLYGSRVRTVDALFKRKRRHVYAAASALLRVNLP